MTIAKLVRPPSIAVPYRELYDQGMPPGDKTGWPDLDALYSVAPGMFTVVTGWPGSGKSQWLDALTLNLLGRGWIFAVSSAENMPHQIHMGKLAAQWVRKPFRRGPTERMSWDEAEEAMHEIGRRYTWIASRTEEALSVHDLLEAASIYFENDPSWFDPAVKKGLVIDPWNELAHTTRPPNMSETEYIRDTLSMIRRWGRLRNIHTWLVAHPQKLRRLDDGKLPVPTPDSISGSQHWWNQADCCITVHRDQGTNSAEVDIHVQKCRFAHIGQTGLCTLKYDKTTGIYHPALRSVGEVKGVR